MIDNRYIERLQALREELWAQSDAALDARDQHTANVCHAKAMGVSEAISALQNYDFDMLILSELEEAVK